MIRSIRNLRRLLLGTVTFAVPVTVSVIDLVGCVVKVEGISMQPALNPLGDGRSAVDYVFLNRWAASAYHFQRGEIVSLRSPSNPDQNLIKRIVALEGDLVKTLAYKEAVVHVPSGHCWVEGDHHKNSMDSNFFGPVSLGLISAKASHIVWPPSRWQRLTIQASEDHRVNCLDTFLES